MQIYQQNMAVAPEGRGAPRQAPTFNTNLFDCIGDNVRCFFIGDNCELCCRSCWCPCVVVGQTEEALMPKLDKDGNVVVDNQGKPVVQYVPDCGLDDGCCTKACCAHYWLTFFCAEFGAWIYPCLQRKAIRKQDANARESYRDCEDCLLSVFCNVCVIRQNASQLQNKTVVSDNSAAGNPLQKKEELQPIIDTQPLETLQLKI